MKYRKFPGTDLTVSALGLGTMRLPTRPEPENPIDEPQAVAMIREAIDKGLTYVDTAYGYHGGNSEKVVGKALADGYRERVTLTTKLPVWLVNEYADMEKILDEQLARLQTDHVDIYLLHALNGQSYDKIKSLDYPRFLADMRAKGKIRHVGFSFHDDSAAFERIARDYDWNVAQIQMNVLDEFNQATLKTATEISREKGMGLIIMEPLRGGALAANVPADVLELYASQPVRRSPVEWAFRYLYDRPEFITILSGMSNREQVLDNLAIFDQAEPNCLTEDEKRMMTRVREIYEARVRVGCTGCEYCMPCPAGVNIPGVFRTLDRHTMFGTERQFYKDYARMQEKGTDGGRCVRCGRCETHCPQHIHIRDLLAEIHEQYHQA